MGLQEKVWMKRLQDQDIPEIQKEFQKSAGGGEMAVEVDWDSFLSDPAASDMGKSPVNNLGGTCFSRLRSAIYTICRSDVGKDAMKSGFKKLTLKHSATDKSCSMKDGVLALVGNFRTDAKAYISEHDMKTAIEAAL